MLDSCWLEGDAVPMDVRFVDAEGAHPHDSDDVVELLCRDDGFVWVDVPAWDEQVDGFLQGLGCHPLVIEACRTRNHVAGLAQQRRVHGDEVVVGVAVHGRDVVALPARLDDERVHAQPGEEAVDLLVPGRHVDPDEPVVALEQDDHVVAVMGVGAL